MALPKIGQTVCFQQGEGDNPLNAYGRRHPAIVASVYGSMVDLAVFPINYHAQCYAFGVPQGDSAWTDRCWYYPE